MAHEDRVALVMKDAMEIPSFYTGTIRSKEVVVVGAYCMVNSCD